MIERVWSEIDATIIVGADRVLAPLQNKSALEAVPACVGEYYEGDSSRRSTVVDKAPVPLHPLFKSYAKEAQLAPAAVKRWSPAADRLIGYLTSR